MLNKLVTLTAVMLMALSGTLVAVVEYEVNDIGTLQTHSSKAIAINNRGQILGWYNIDGTPRGQQFFVRDRDGTFHLIGNLESKVIEWKFLKNDGRVYGTCNEGKPSMNPVEVHRRFIRNKFNLYGSFCYTV